MAEEKKDVKKTEPVKVVSNSMISWEEILLLILGIIALLFVFIPRFVTHIDTTVTKNVNSEQKNLNWKNIYYDLINKDQNIQQPSVIKETKSKAKDIMMITFLITFSALIFFILLFSIIIYYNKFRRDLIIQSQKKKFETEKEIKEEELIDERNEEILEKIAPDTNGMINPRWETVGRYYKSANQSDWKLAILEADIMLYEVLDKSGFKGDSIGEMLKNADRSKLNNIDNAWSAHKVRNEIAHSGTDYKVSRDVVDRTIAQYEKVFDELNFI